jgi:hypothetical protein
MSGVVIDVQVFTREGIERDKRAQSIIDTQLAEYKKDLTDRMHRRGRHLCAPGKAAAPEGCQRRPEEARQGQQGHQGLSRVGESA